MLVMVMIMTITVDDDDAKLLLLLMMMMMMMMLRPPSPQPINNLPVGIESERVREDILAVGDGVDGTGITPTSLGM